MYFSASSASSSVVSWMKYYNKETKEPGVAEIIIAKPRNGPVGTTKLTFLRQWTKFDNLAPCA